MKKSIKEQARESQRQELAKHSDKSTEALEALALGIYDQIDALDPERRTILSRDILRKMASVTHDLDDVTDRAVLTTLAGIANYTNEVTREEAGYTSTGDAAVDSIIEDISEMFAAQFRAVLGTGVADVVDAAANRVRARVEAGEDFETVAREEEAAMKEALAAAHAAQSEKVAAPVAKNDTSTGFYL